MAVARRSVPQHILLGEVGESFGGELTSAPIQTEVHLPTPIDITVGSDGLLLAARSTLFGPSVTLDQWPGGSPYVSGEVYLVPWEGIRGIDTLTTDDGSLALAIRHTDGSSTVFGLPTLGAPARFLDECRGLPQGAGDLARNDDLWAAVQSIIVETPGLSEDEILEELHNANGWLDCTRTVLDEILWDEESPTFFEANMWFVDEELDSDEIMLDPLSRLVVESLSADGATVEMLLDELGEESISAADIYEILYDPNVPTFTRGRAWYLEHIEDGGEA